MVRAEVPNEEKKRDPKPRAGCGLPVRRHSKKDARCALFALELRSGGNLKRVAKRAKPPRSGPRAERSVVRGSSKRCALCAVRKNIEPKTKTQTAKRRDRQLTHFHQIVLRVVKTIQLDIFG